MSEDSEQTPSVLDVRCPGGYDPTSGASRGCDFISPVEEDKIKNQKLLKKSTIT